LIEERISNGSTEITCNIPQSLTLFKNGEVCIRKPSKYASVSIQKLTLTETEDLLKELKDLTVLIDLQIEIRKDLEN